MKDIALHILDLVQNSISAKATLIEVDVHDSVRNNIYTVCIRDNGKGIDAEMMKTITDPWTTTRTTRKVGLGIPLFKQNAEIANGGFAIKSELGKGTELSATFENNHIDRIPEGDLKGVLLMLVSANEQLDFVFTYKTDKGEYVFDTREIKLALEGVSLNQPEIRQFLKEMLQENIAILY